MASTAPPIARRAASISQRLEQASSRHDLLSHPFYLRWNAGELSASELARYAGEYRHLVVALASASEQAARSAGQLAERGAIEADLSAELADHACEEREHIALWDDFLRAAGPRLGGEPLAATRRCAAIWAGDEERSFAATLGTLFAIESTQPRIARSKREGLTAHYGFAAGSATAYFQLHETSDGAHAQLAARALAGSLSGSGKGERAAAEAQAAEAAASALAANWQLLDALEAQRV